MSSAAPVLNLTGMPEEYREAFLKTRATIVNITEIEYTREQTYGNYIIPGKLAGEEFSLTEIAPRTAKIDLGDKREFHDPISARGIAEDLVRMINGDAGENSFLGVFVCQGKSPTQQELSAAHARLDSYYAWCVREGDTSWQRYHRIDFIPDALKRAVAALKLNREWAALVQPNLECRGCGQLVKPGVAICLACGAVQDEKKAREIYPERFAAAAARAPEPEPEPQTAVGNKGKPKS